MKSLKSLALSICLILTVIYSSSAQIATEDDFAWITSIYNDPENDSIYLYRLSNFEMIYSVQAITPLGCELADNGIGGIALDPSTGDYWVLIQELESSCTSYNFDLCEGDRVLAKIDLLTGIVDTSSFICGNRSIDSNVDYPISFQFNSNGDLYVFNYDEYVHTVDKTTGAQLSYECQLEDSGPANIIFDPNDDDVVWHSEDDDLYKYDLNTCETIDLDPMSPNDYVSLPDDFYNIMWYKNDDTGIEGPAGQDDIDDPLYVYDIHTKEIIKLSDGDATRNWYPRQNNLYFNSKMTITAQNDLESDDPLNCEIDGVAYYHDTLIIMHTTLIPNLDIVLGTTTNLFVGGCGGLTAADGSTVIEVSPGVYKLAIWRPVDTFPSVEAVANGSQATSSMTSAFAPISLPSTIPTLGQWGLICLSLVLLIIGSVYLSSVGSNKLRKI